MSNNRLFVHRQNGVAVLNFDLIDGYSIHPTHVSFNLHVKLKDQLVDIIPINDISDELSLTNNGIYYEIKKICTQLNESKNFTLPLWMRNTTSMF